MIGFEYIVLQRLAVLKSKVEVKRHMKRFYSTKQAMETQVTTLQELIVDIPLLEPDTERFVQMIKAEMFLIEEAIRWMSKEPEYLKNVLTCIRLTFSEVYIQEFDRNGLPCPYELIEAIDHLFTTEENSFDHILHMIETYGEEIYETESYTHFWIDVDEILETYRCIEISYPDIDCKLDPSILPELD